MPDVSLNMGLGSSEGATPDEGGPIYTNAYVEMTGGEGKSPTVIRATEGRKVHQKIAETGPCRALFEHNGVLFTVIGRVVASSSRQGQVTILGGLTSDGFVTFAVNRKSGGGQVCLAGGGQTGIIQSGAFNPISDGDLPPPIDVCFLDGYFVWTIEDGRMFSSALDEGTQINALDFATAEASPDKNVRGLSRGRELIVFGDKSFQVFAADNGTQFPFGPVGGTASSEGCGAAASALVLNAQQADTLVWIDNNGIVKATPSYNGQRISTHSVERAIEGDPNWRDIIASTYTRNGHVFYIIAGSNFTKVYDFSTGKWHDRNTYGAQRWNASSAVRFGDKIIVGDALNGTLYVLDPDTVKDASDHMVMTLQLPIVHQYPNRLRVNALRFDTLPGRGLNTAKDHNRDPEMMLEISKDGGNTWGNERHIPMGKKGEFSTRVVERRFGVTSEDGFIPRVSVSAEVVRGFTSNGSANVDLLSP